MAAPNTLHAIYQSPLVSVHDYCCRPHGPDGRREEHSREHGVVFVRSGVFEKHVGRESVVADPNAVLFFNAGQAYRVTHPVAGGDRCTVFRVRPDVLAEMLRAFNPAAADGAAPFAHLSGPCDSNTYLAMHKLARGLERGHAVDPLAVDEMALRLTAGAIENAHRVRGERPDQGRAETRRAHADWAEHAKLVLARHFRERLSIDDVASEVHCSPYHLCRIFRRHAGTSIHQYVTRLRLRAALDRLMDGPPDLTRLALDTGFASHSHFTTAFAREFGATPSQIRDSKNRRTNQSTTKRAGI
jgi:AraC-like DNA-binding protein